MTDLSIRERHLKHVMDAQAKRSGSLLPANARARAERYINQKRETAEKKRANRNVERAEKAKTAEMKRANRNAERAEKALQRAETAAKKRDIKDEMKRATRHAGGRKISKTRKQNRK